MLLSSWIVYPIFIYFCFSGQSGLQYLAILSGILRIYISLCVVGSGRACVNSISFFCWKKKRSGKHRRLAKKWISKESEDTRHVTFQGYDVMQLRDDHYESLQHARKAEPPEHVGRMWNSWCANGVLGADYGFIPLDSLLLFSCVLSHSTLFHFACISWI